MWRWEQDLIMPNGRSGCHPDSLVSPGYWLIKDILQTALSQVFMGDNQEKEHTASFSIIPSNLFHGKKSESRANKRRGSIHRT